MFEFKLAERFSRRLKPEKGERPKAGIGDV